MYDDSVHAGLTTVSQFVPSIFLSVLSLRFFKIPEVVQYLMYLTYTYDPFTAP